LTPTTAEAPARIRVASRLFGPLDVALEECYTMPEGMLGFAGERRFVLLPAAAQGVFWFQSVDDGALMFLILDPFEFQPGYEIELPDLPEQRAPHTIILTIVTLPRQRGEACTTNLQAPLVFDLRDRTVRQAVLQDPRYHTRHPVDLRGRFD
jgi:flagellar assembly factor FliW